MEVTIDSDLESVELAECGKKENKNLKNERK